MNNPQHQKVLTNKGNIVGALKSTEGAIGNLTTQFHEKLWIPDTENPTAERLVTTALGRIKLDPAEFDIFIGMLKAVPGLGPIVKILEGSPSPTDRTSRQSTDKASRQSSPYTQGRVDLGTVISIDQLDKIARDLLIRWEDLSPSLRLTQQQEQNIRETYRVYGDQKREALRAWKHNKGKGATFGALIAAAKKVSNMQLADDIRDLMKTLQVETERSQQSQLGEQYDDEPDSGDEKKPKTKPHQEGQLKSDSGPHSLTEEPDIRRRKKKVTMETPPEDDEKSDTHTPPPTEGNGGQNTKGSDSGTKNKNKPTVDLTASILGIGITIKNVLKGPSAVVLVILILLVTLAVAIFFIVRELKK